MGPMRRTPQKLVREQHGSVLMLTGLAILILFAVAGAGVDFGRQQLVRMKLQNASDAAAVAAASLKNATVAEREAIALRYYNLNYPQSFLGVERPDPEIIIGDTISVEASTVLMANFISNVGVQRLEAEGRTVVNASSNSSQNYDVILVMDNSSSMARAATAPAYADGDVTLGRSFTLNQCVAGETGYYPVDCPFYRLQIMADTTCINYASVNECSFNGARNFCDRISDGASEIQRIACSPSNSMEKLGLSIRGQTRLNALRSVALTFVDTLLTQGEPGNRIGLIAWGTDILFQQPLSDDSAIVTQGIRRMAAYGATNPVAAMQSAVTMSSNFDASHVKAVVLLTDGIPTFADASNIRFQREGNMTVRRDNQNCDSMHFCDPAVNLTRPLCTQLKDDGVIVYTIAFGQDVLTGPDAGRAQSFLRNCASIDGAGNPRFFSAPDGAALADAFKQITTQLGKLRIRE